MSEARSYELLSVLGSGGFGTVYHARFLGEGGFTKEVALKVLHPGKEDVSELASRLRDEARVLGLLRHRAIVGVDRLTQLDGRWTVVMEYVEGHDLSKLLKRGPVPVGVSLEIVTEVAGALHAAYTRSGPDGHPLHLLHRDLKPSNIRVTPFGEVKVLDFGIARAEFATREAKTRSLSFGTPEYMSPERLDFAGDTASGDVYALGAVLYEMLTGTLFGRSSAVPERHAAKLARAVEVVREAGVPRPVIELMASMLAYDPSTRPSAGEVERLAQDLGRRLGQVSLRAWVDEVLPAIPSERWVDTAGLPDLCGSILIERPEPAVSDNRPDGAAGADSVANPKPAPGPVRRPIVSWWQALQFLAGMAVSGLAGLVVWVAFEAYTGREVTALEAGSAPPPVAKAALTDPAPPAAPKAPQLPPVDSTSAATPSPGAGSTSAKVKAKAASSSGASTAGASRARASAPKASVGLKGDATRVALVSSGRRTVLPAEVPAGTYRIVASFDDLPEADMGVVDVDQGQTTTVSCLSQFGKCTVAKEKP